MFSIRFSSPPNYLFSVALSFFSVTSVVVLFDGVSPSIP
jgi:hypothetical protein